MFDILFLLALFVPPVAVIAGAAILAAPRFHHHAPRVAHPARA
jgi:hypothetical protein